MPVLAELMGQIDELDPVEYENLMHSLMAKQPRAKVIPEQDFPLIVSTPDVCGGAARFIRTRIPVWTIERMRQLGVSESDILRNYPILRAADLSQGWSYAEKHRDEIEQIIHKNEME